MSFLTLFLALSCIVASDFVLCFTSSCFYFILARIPQLSRVESHEMKIGDIVEKNQIKRYKDNIEKSAVKNRKPMLLVQTSFPRTPTFTYRALQLQLELSVA